MIIRITRFRSVYGWHVYDRPDEVAVASSWLPRRTKEAAQRRAERVARNYLRKGPREELYNYAPTTLVAGEDHVKLIGPDA